MKLLSESEARMIIERFKNEVHRHEDIAIQKIPNSRPSGLADELIGIVDEWIISIDSMGFSGIQITGTALETANNNNSEAIRRLRTYVITDSPKKGQEIDAEEAEIYEKTVFDFHYDLDSAIDPLLIEAEQEEEERQKKEEEERRKQEEKQKRLEERQNLEAEYYRARERLRKQYNRRIKAGVDVDFDIPEIPQKITQGSINRIENLIDKIQDEYRYLAGRGYRGQRK